MNNTLYFNNEEHGDYINLYELDYKCKKWAYSVGYIVTINSYSAMVISHLFGCELKHNILGDPTTTSPYDPQLTMQACQWILDNKDINENKN